MRPLLTSLSLRIFTICIVFLLIPFMVHALLYDEGSHAALIHLLYFLVFLIFIGGTATILLVRRMAKPLRQLDTVMGSLEKGDFSARYIPDRMGYEINILGAHFNRMIDALFQLKMGEEIQKSLFPKSMPRIKGVDIRAGIVFAKELGGDFYDVFETKDRLIFTIADASGKGVEACLLSLGVRSLMRASISNQNVLADALFFTNKLFCEDVADTGYFVTAWVGSFDPKERVLEYSSCGHPHALLFRNNEVKELSTPGMALGVELIPATIASIKLKENDFLLLYTDGAIEATGWSKKRFIEEIQTHQNLSRQDLLSHLLATIAPPGEAPFDDITLLLISIS